MAPEDPTRFFAFTADHVSRMTGLSKHKLRYWAETDFFRPHYTDDSGRPFGRIYSFRDVVGLRVIALLQERDISLQRLRKIRESLLRFHETPFASLRLYVNSAGEVIVREPETGRHIEADGAPEQAVLDVDLEAIASDVQQAFGRLRERPPAQLGKVERNRYIVHNEEVLAGTRIPIQSVWNLHRANYSTEQILQEYPTLTAKDVDKAIARARRRTRRRPSKRGRKAS